MKTVSFLRHPTFRFQCSLSFSKIGLTFALRLCRDFGLSLALIVTDHQYGLGSNLFHVAFSSSQYTEQLWQSLVNFIDIEIEDKLAVAIRQRLQNNISD